MPSTTLKRRWTEDGMRGKEPKKQKKFKRQRAYHSSSEDEHEAVDAPQDSKPLGTESGNEGRQKKGGPRPKSIMKGTTNKQAKQISADDTLPGEAEDESEEDVDEEGHEDSNASEDSELSETPTNDPRKVRKRNDPAAFATSISKILGTKLTSAKRSEPILSRSKAAQETNKSLADHKLTVKANRALLAEKRATQEKGRVKDVLGLQKEDVSTADIVAEEKRLRKTAQKGVIKLFNAVRAAQVKAEQAEKDARQKGVVGMGQREEKVKEMSKQGFLDMIAGGGKRKEGSVEA